MAANNGEQYAKALLAVENAFALNGKDETTFDFSSQQGRQFLANTRLADIVGPAQANNVAPRIPYDSVTVRTTTAQGNFLNDIAEGNLLGTYEVTPQGINVTFDQLITHEEVEELFDYLEFMPNYNAALERLDALGYFRHPGKVKKGKPAKVYTSNKKTKKFNPNNISDLERRGNYRSVAKYGAVAIGGKRRKTRKGKSKSKSKKSRKGTRRA